MIEFPLALSESTTALVVVILGGGGLGGIAALRRVGPDRTRQVVSYQGDIIDDINEDRERLRGLADELEERKEALEESYRKVLADRDELREKCDDLARRVDELERLAAERLK